MPPHSIMRMGLSTEYRSVYSQVDNHFVFVFVFVFLLAMSSSIFLLWRLRLFRTAAAKNVGPKYLEIQHIWNIKIFEDKRC